MMKIKAEVKEFLYEDHLKGQFENLKDSDSLLEKGLIDSVKMLDLICFLEQHYDITVHEDDLYPENFDTLTAIESYVISKQNH